MNRRTFLTRCSLALGGAVLATHVTLGRLVPAPLREPEPLQMVLWDWKNHTWRSAEGVIYEQEAPVLVGRQTLPNDIVGWVPSGGMKRDPRTLVTTDIQLAKNIEDHVLAALKRKGIKRPRKGFQLP